VRRIGSHKPSYREHRVVGMQRPQHTAGASSPDG
jgi:hypothetical protein